MQVYMFKIFLRNAMLNMWYDNEMLQKGLNFQRK